MIKGRLLNGLCGFVVAGVLGACSGGETAGGPDPAAGASRGTATTIALDLTTARSATTIAADYREATRRYAEPTLQHGGRLRVVVFAAAGVAPVVLIDETMKNEEELSGNARKRFIIDARENVANLVDQALGLTPPAPDSDMAVRLEELKTDGSDVAGAFSAEVEELDAADDATLHILSDTLQRDETIDFSATVEDRPADELVAALEPLLPRDASGVSIEMHGAGISGNEVNVSTPRAQKLVQIWTAACKATGAECAVESQI